MYQRGAGAMRDMGLSNKRTTEMMRKLHRHAVKALSLGDIVRQKRRLESQLHFHSGEGQRTGVG